MLPSTKFLADGFRAIGIGVELQREVSKAIIRGRVEEGI